MVGGETARSNIYAHQGVPDLPNGNRPIPPATFRDEERGDTHHGGVRNLLPGRKGSTVTAVREFLKRYPTWSKMMEDDIENQNSSPPIRVLALANPSEHSGAFHYIEYDDWNGKRFRKLFPSKDIKNKNNLNPQSRRTKTLWCWSRLLFFKTGRCGRLSTTHLALQPPRMAAVSSPSSALLGAWDTVPSRPWLPIAWNPTALDGARPWTMRRITFGKPRRPGTDDRSSGMFGGHVLPIWR